MVGIRENNGEYYAKQPLEELKMNGPSYKRVPMAKQQYYKFVVMYVIHPLSGCENNGCIYGGVWCRKERGKRIVCL